MQKQTKLTHQLTRTIFLVAFIPSLIMSVLLLERHYQDNKHATQRKIQLGLQRGVAEFVFHFASLSSNIELLVSDRALSEAVEDIMYFDDSMNKMRQFNTLHKLNHSSYLVDAEFRVVDEYNGAIDSFEQSTLVKKLIKEFAKAALAIDQQYVSQFNDSGLLKGLDMHSDSHFGFVIVAPVFNRALAFTSRSKPVGYFISVTAYQDIVRLLTKNSKGSLSMSYSHQLVATSSNTRPSVAKNMIMASDTLVVGSDKTRNQIVLALDVSQPIRTLWQIIFASWDALSLGILGVALFSVYVSLRLGQWINHPFEQLKKLIKRFNQGQYRVEDELEFRFSELIEVKLLLQSMGDRIEQQFSSLTHKNLELEDMARVNQRYLAEVQALNENLEKRVEQQTRALSESLGREEQNRDLLQQLLNLSVELQGDNKIEQVGKNALLGLAQILDDMPGAIYLSSKKNDKHDVYFNGFNKQQCHWLTQHISTAGAVFDANSVAFINQGATRYTAFSLPFTNGDCAGCLVLGTDSLPDEGRDILNLFARQLEAIIESIQLNQELDNQAHTDTLTQIGNRKAFNDACSRAHKRYQRYPDCHYALFVIDANGLKQVNDNYGHEQGDELIRHLSGFLKKSVRQTDTVFRLAGDEFAILLENGTLQHCQLLHQRLLHDAREEQTKLQTKEGNRLNLPLSFSLGFASSEEYLPDGIFRTADSRMYQNKAAYYKHRQTTGVDSEARSSDFRHL